VGGTITIILMVCLVVWWLRQWWKERKDKYRDDATANEIEYLEKLADEHERGVSDHGERLRFLLTLFYRDASEPEQYKHRIDKIRRIIETDPFEAKIKQAIKFKWTKTAEVTEDGQGGVPWMKRSVHFTRGKEEAVLWHKDATITLVRLYAPLNFDDFVELEEFISKHPREEDLDDATGERKYLSEIELFFIRHGYRDDLIHIRATDFVFLGAFTKLFKAGYAAGEDNDLVAALVLSAIQFYDQDCARSIRVLTQRTEKFNRWR
jgi:hypothetical protein